MAKLTDTLATERSGRETERPVDPGMGLFEGLLKGASAMYGAEQAGQQTMAKREASRRQAEADALEKEKSGALNFYATQMTGLAAEQQQPVLTETITTTQEGSSFGQGELGDAQFATQATLETGQRLQTMQAAVSQGRMSAAQYQMRTTAILREAFARFPNSQYAVYEALDKQGINHPLMAPWKREEAKLDKMDAAEIEREEGYVTYAMDNLGQGLYGDIDPSSLTREELVGYGQRIKAVDENFARSVRVATEQRAERGDLRAQDSADREGVSFRQGQGDRADEAAGEAAEIATGTYLSEALGPGIDAIHLLGNDPSKPAETKFRELSPVINNFRQTARGIVDKKLDQMLARGEGVFTVEQADRIRERMYKKIDDVHRLYDPSNPNNIIQQSEKITGMIKSATGLRVEETMPLLSEMSRRFGADTEGLSQAVETLFRNPKVSGAIARELKGLDRDLLSIGPGATRMKNFLDTILDENHNVRDLPPNEGKEVIADTANYINGINKSVRLGTASGATVKGYLNGLGTIANAAVYQTAQSGVGNLAVASEQLASPNRIDALRQGAFQSEHREYAHQVADGMRVAVHRNLQAALAVNTGDKYWRVQYDVRTQKTQLVRTDVPFPREPQFTKTGRLTKGRELPQKPNKQTNGKATIIARNMNFLMQTTDLEDAMPIQKWTKKEQATYYSVGNVPEGYTRGEAAKVSRSWEQNVADFNDWMQKDFSADDIVVPKVDPQAFVDRKMGTEPGQDRIVNYQLKGLSGVRAVPSSVQTMGDFVQWGNGMINAHESKVGKGKVSTAAGVFQITKSTLEDFGPEALGPEWKSAPYSAANQDKVAQAIFNHARTRPNAVAALRGRWAGLTQKDAEKIVNAPWSEAREVIQDRESRTRG